MKKDQSRTLKKVLLRIKPHWPLLCVSLVLALVYVAMSLYIPILVGRAVDGIISAGNVNFPGVWRNLTAIALCAGVAGLAQWVMNELNNRTVFRVPRDVRNEAFAHIQRLPLSYLDKHPHGDMVSRVVADVDTFADGLLMGFTQLFTGVMTILGTLVFMLRMSWQIALVVVVITPVSLLVAGFISKQTYSMFRLQTQTRGEQSALIDETINGLKVARAFGHEKAAMGQFDEINDRLERHPCRQFSIPLWSTPAPGSSILWCMPAWDWWVR